MKDRFKFRAWVKEKKVIIYGCTPAHERDSVLTPHFLMDLMAGDSAEYELDEIVLSQCTGSKDSNNKLIYEGDILETFQRKSGGEDSKNVIYRGLVSFRPSRGFYQKKVIVTELYEDEEVYQDGAEWIKFGELPRIIQSRANIVGNIYQNPELLENND